MIMRKLNCVIAFLLSFTILLMEFKELKLQHSQRISDNHATLAIRLKGRTGNWLFQIAFGSAIAGHYKETFIKVVHKILGFLVQPIHATSFIKL